MKALIMSDSHGDQPIVTKLVEHYQNEVDTIIHCGDSEMMMSDPLVDQMVIVQGNMDFASFPIIQEINSDVGTILVTHGHEYNVNSSLLGLELLAQQERAKVVCFGHTHQLGVQVNQGVVFINPGSISQPRGKYVTIGGTYVIADFLKNEINVQFYNRDMQPLDELKCHFTEGDLLND